jgi:hypothetical protein
MFDDVTLICTDVADSPLKAIDRAILSDTANPSNRQALRLVPLETARVATRPEAP